MKYGMLEYLDALAEGDELFDHTGSRWYDVGPDQTGQRCGTRLGRRLLSKESPADSPASPVQQLKAEIAADVNEAIGHICGGTYADAVDHLDSVRQKLSAV
jgi:hypothetical protein